MAIKLLTILAAVYFVLAIIAILNYLRISLDFNSSYTTEEFAKLSEEPFVSIIVPTYNEEINIVKCLESLRSLEYSNFEIILSDGGSADRTVELAKPYVDKIVIDERVPDGWVGKNYGCHIAYKIAQGDLLLFTDADTYHKPDSLSKIVSILKQKNAGLISFLPYQKLEKWWESIIPVYFFLSNIAASGKRSINNPEKSDSYLAIGQYLLFTREAYEEIGGHLNLKGSIIEDFAFARVVKTELKSLYFMDNNNLVFARMYPNSVKHCWTGFKKTLYAGTKLTPPRRILADVIHCLWGIASPIAVTLSVLFGSTLMIILSSITYCIYPIIMWSFWRKKGRHYWITYLFLPLLMLIFIFTMIVSTLEIVINNKTTWKGRTYQPNLKAGLEISSTNPITNYETLGQLETDLEIELNLPIVKGVNQSSSYSDNSRFLTNQSFKE